MDKNAPNTPPPVNMNSGSLATGPQAGKQQPSGPAAKLKNKGVKPHHLHDGTLLVPGHVTEVPGETVDKLKAAKFGKTGKSSWEVLLESGLEETDEDATAGETHGDIKAPPAKSHLEQEENRLPYNPESADPKWQATGQPAPHHHKQTAWTDDEEKPAGSGASSSKQSGAPTKK